MRRLPDPTDSFLHEEGFLLTCGPTRLAKMIALYEAYKRIREVPGAVIECGVFRGASFCTISTLRSMLEHSAMRQLIAFDTFTSFAETSDLHDAAIRADIQNIAGLECITRDELLTCLAAKGHGMQDNIILVEGDICETVPKFVQDNPALRISLLSIDVDFDRATQTILDHLFPRVVIGGVVLFDDYGTFLGETVIADRFLAEFGYRLRQFPFARHPCYLVKGELDDGSRR